MKQTLHRACNICGSQTSVLTVALRQPGTPTGKSIWLCNTHYMDAIWIGVSMLTERKDRKPCAEE